MPRPGAKGLPCRRPMIYLRSSLRVTASPQHAGSRFNFEKQALKDPAADALAAQLRKPSSGPSLPGGGQIYNRKYWKLPIVWGAFMACYYSITWNNRQYQEYHAAYRDLSGPDRAQHLLACLRPYWCAGLRHQQYQSSLRSAQARQ